MEPSEPNIPPHIRAKMSKNEQRLARRIHNQRRRLAQLETMKGWHSARFAPLHSMWRTHAERIGKRLAELEAQLREKT